MRNLLLLLLCFFVMSSNGQTSVGSLKPAHAAALEEYLSTHPKNGFRQEYVLDVLDPEYLKEIRKSFRKGFMPSYAKGDFNRDGVEDFALLLTRKGESVENDIKLQTHNPDYPLTLVVFNGVKRSAKSLRSRVQSAPIFKVAHTTDLMGPPAAFINFDGTLYYGVFESDADTFILAPAGKGYIIEYPKPL